MMPFRLISRGVRTLTRSKQIQVGQLSQASQQVLFGSLDMK